VEAPVDIARLAFFNLVDGRLHIIVDATGGNPAEVLARVEF